MAPALSRSVEYEIFRLVDDGPIGNKSIATELSIHAKPDRGFSHRRSRIVSGWASGMGGLRRPSGFRRAHHFQPALSGKKQHAQHPCLRCIRWPYVSVNNWE